MMNTDKLLNLHPVQGSDEKQSSKIKRVKISASASTAITRLQKIVKCGMIKNGNGNLEAYSAPKEDIMKNFRKL